MLHQADIRKGMRLLDVGCGGGGASEFASRLGMHVTGLDAAETMIDIARKRVPEGDFRVGDMEDLPFEDDSFDVVFASLSIMYTAKPIMALYEMKRVTRPEGRVVVGIWGRPQDCGVYHLERAVTETLSSPSRTLPGTFSLSGPGEMEELLEQAGLRVQNSGEVDIPFQYPDFEVCFQALLSTGPLQFAKRFMGKAKLRTAIQRAVEPFRSSDGRIRIENRCRHVLAIAG
jgi:SAM-dependent methyltransferase